jgi:hypothetical protein
MKILATIHFSFEDDSPQRAQTRANELASWMGENLAGAYGSDSNLEVIGVLTTPLR